MTQKCKEICERCERVYFAGPYSHYCSKCRKQIQSEAGKKSAAMKKKDGKE